jgi:hypothetical protein
LRFVCDPFITGNGEGCRITLRLPPLVTLYIAAFDVWTNVDDGVSKTPKMLKNKANATREIFMFLHNSLPFYNRLNIYHPRSELILALLAWLYISTKEHIIWYLLTLFNSTARAIHVIVSAAT